MADSDYTLEGLFREIVIFTGVWRPSHRFRVLDSDPEWYRTELLNHGECHLGGRYTHPGCNSGERVPVGGDDANRGGSFAGDMGGVLPDECWGAFPIVNYDIGYDGGGMFNVEASLWGWLTNFFFGVGKLVMQTSFTLVEFGMAFDLMDYAEFVGDLSRLYETELVAGLKIKEIGWLALMGYVTLGLARGKYAAAGGEFLVTVVMLALAGVLLANVTGYMQGASNTMDGLSNQVLNVGADGLEEDDTGSSGSRSTPQLIHMMQNRLHGLFIADPYDYINWGGPLTGRCAELRDQILSVGPHKGDPWPRDYMRQVNYEEEDGCPAAADYNEQASADRFFGSLLNGIAALLIGVLLGLVAFTVIIGKFITAILFALAPIAAATAIFPGSMRKAAWSWVATLVQAMIAVVGMSLILSMMMITVDRVLRVAEANNMGLWERWLLVAGIAAALLAGRKKLLAAAQSGGQNLTDRLGRLSPAAANGGYGGGGGQIGGSGSALLGAQRGAGGGSAAANVMAGISTTAATAGAIGTGSLVAARATGAVMRGGSAPFRAVGGVWLGRRAEKRAANRTLENQFVERTLNLAQDAMGQGDGNSVRGLMSRRGQRKFDRTVASYRKQEKHWAKYEAKRTRKGKNANVRTLNAQLVGKFKGAGERIRVGFHQAKPWVRMDRTRYAEPTWQSGGSRRARRSAQRMLAQQTNTLRTAGTLAGNMPLGHENP